VFRQPRLIRRLRSGDYELNLDEQERAVVGSLVHQLRTVLLSGEDDESLRRLFPTAYHDDPKRDAEYQVLTHDELLKHRVACLDVVMDTVGADRVGEEQLLSWMGAINDLRLVLGTKLDVSEDTEMYDVDPEDPDAAVRAAYGYLGWLLENVIEALS
jgi:hypothetical protein